MSKEKFFYNIATLRYEKIELSLRHKLNRVFGFLSAVGVASAIMVALAFEFIGSPRERQAQREIEQWKSEVKALGQELDQMSAAILYLQQKDRSVYRMVMEADPVEEPLWNGGVATRDKYAHLQNLSDGELLLATYNKINALKQKMAVQKNSYEEIANLVQGKEDMLASIPSIIPIKKTMIKGKGNLNVLSGFGMRVHPIYKIMKMHTGIDFGAPQGTPVQAAGNGVIIKTQFDGSGYGNNIVIDHGYGYQTLYGHLSRIDVKVGQKVIKGQTIGAVGSTGTSTAPHLHYEVMKNGDKIDPKQFCLDGLTPEEYDNFVKQSMAGGQTFH